MGHRRRRVSADREKGRQMIRRLRLRGRLEAALASLTGVLLLITLAAPDWIEAVFGADPDQHSGRLEWAIVLGLLGVTVLAAGAAYADWRRPATSLASRRGGDSG